MEIPWCSGGHTRARDPGELGHDTAHGNFYIVLRTAWICISRVNRKKIKKMIQREEADLIKLYQIKS